MELTMKMKKTITIESEIATIILGNNIIASSTITENFPSDDEDFIGYIELNFIDIEVQDVRIGDYVVAAYDPLINTLHLFDDEITFFGGDKKFDLLFLLRLVEDQIVYVDLEKATEYEYIITIKNVDKDSLTKLSI